MVSRPLGEHFLEGSPTVILEPCLNSTLLVLPNVLISLFFCEARGTNSRTVGFSQQWCTGFLHEVVGHQRQYLQTESSLCIMHCSSSSSSSGNDRRLSGSSTSINCKRTDSTQRGVAVILVFNVASVFQVKVGDTMTRRSFSRLLGVSRADRQPHMAKLRACFPACGLLSSSLDVSDYCIDSFHAQFSRLRHVREKERARALHFPSL